ncbi:hypothetical protein AQUSIP_08600 [Aquicella siphonis]|uniref:Uncharacterized protein n=1 Tax=Aquicella siphonis TaxID=254247 RepID=A0A5E4PF09_9COXI|nr:hypothetical protein [Aquicella siphonis]VVC75570.1 hypothetical protein AQUSIP_08600 [Aquicella siphonis]
MNNRLFQADSAGMASSPDRKKEFGDLSKQSRWLEFSSDVIKRFSSNVSAYPDRKPVLRDDIRCPPGVLNSMAGCAYAFLANERRIIAKELKHKPLTHQFGWFNKPGFRASDDFLLIRDLPGQKDAIFELIGKLAAGMQGKDAVDYGCYEISRSQRADQSMVYTIKMTNPLVSPEVKTGKKISEQGEYAEPELTITFEDYGDQDPRTRIQVEHPMTPFDFMYEGKTEYMEDKFREMDDHFKACLGWTSDKSVEDFLVNAGALAHILARMQPVGRGNSAIVEWMIRGLAAAVGIELGAFNYETKIGWDFKAFLTPVRADYANWFAKNAFVSARYQAEFKVENESGIETKLNKSK